MNMQPGIARLSRELSESVSQLHLKFVVHIILSSEEDDPALRDYGRSLLAWA
jgi:hypothetical protein